MRAGDSPFALRAREALRALAGSLTWQIQHHESVDSTMRSARELIAEGARSHVAVVAGEQSAGRGRRERVFVSPPGGLYVTASLEAPPRLEDAWRMSFAGALAAARALEALGVAGLRFEWPNDLFQGERKVGGVLAELLSGTMLPRPGEGALVLVGIGLNTGPDPRETDAERAGPAGALSVRLEDKGPELTAHLLFEIEKLARQCADPTGWRDVLQSVRSLSALRGGEPVLVRRHDGSELSGIAWDLLEDGSLELRDDEGNAKVIRYGEVVRT